jgi:FAD-dependent oxidoreductase domain-containing protein 1
MKYDVVVIGGGAIGSCVAYFLRMHKKACSVCVIEKDMSYQLASTPRASGGVRQLFSKPQNIAMSQFTLDIISRFKETLSVDGECPDLNWRQQGYLFIMSHRAIRILADNINIQKANGVDAQFLDASDLKRKFPSMRTEDLGGGVYSPKDGWLDPSAFLQAFKKKAQSIGAKYIQQEVTAIESTGPSGFTVKLAAGESIECSYVVNAAGAWAAEIGDMVGMKLPISPMKRYESYFESSNKIEPLPYVKDLDRLAFRPEGAGYSGGVPNTNEPRGYDFEVDHSYFDRIVWPALAHRFPAFESTKVGRTWAGLYDQNEFDGNPIIGPWTGKMENFLVAAGYSGHGLMHAPATGRALAELILDGRYNALDLSPLGYERIAANRPFYEEGIV